jgi:hypothetical protein
MYYVVSYAKAHRSSLLLFGHVTNYHGKLSQLSQVTCVIYFDPDSSRLNAILFSIQIIQNYSY